jgi:hypothetical protein
MTVSKPKGHSGASDQRPGDPAADTDPVPDADAAADTDPVADASQYTLILGNGPDRHTVAPEIEHTAAEPHRIWVAGEGVGRRAQDEAGAASDAASDQQPSRCGGSVAGDRRK